ncbi:sulfite exporter TauE/SafE family protein [Pseudooceanicola aestuarii]|uniref:sulfite exporter TauE/SafE family protein n=1 Tax=Pseudooceanicola aestuarii TaxID=2697319 RepID=UPI0013D58D8A|nr:sulfite exporter TauE/SafE family protein [Pseudooceanicola aestuarii]
MPAGTDPAGLLLLLGTVLVAGVVYGFAGFGAALIFMPVAVRILPPQVAVAAFAISALSSLVTVVPRAVPLVDRRGVTILIATATLASFAGVWVLRVADVTGLRWAVIGVTAVTLLALVSGWRYRTAPRDSTRAAVGLATGFVGGATGLLGPVMVLFQLAGRDSIARSRATALVFLTVTSLALVPVMALQGLLTAQAVGLGLVMLLPYGLGTVIGHALFRPEGEAGYRLAAYLLIGVAVVIGLPLFD